LGYGRWLLQKSIWRGADADADARPQGGTLTEVGEAGGRGERARLKDEAKGRGEGLQCSRTGGEEKKEEEEEVWTRLRGGR